MALLLSAASDDGSLVALAAPSSGGDSSSSSNRCLIQVYETTPSTNNNNGKNDSSLQLTLTHTTSTNAKLRQLVMVGRSLVLGLFGRRQVVVWDLERGVASCTHTLDGDGDDGGSNSDDDKSYVAIATTPYNPEDSTTSDLPSHYYILMRLGRKLLVHEYHSSTHKLVRKIKSGKMDTHVDNQSGGEGTPDEGSLIVTPSRILVRTQDHGVRIMDKETGDKIGKIKTSSSSKKSSSSTSTGTMTPSQEMCLCTNNSDVIALILGSGAVGVYDVSTSKQLAEIPPSQDSSSSTSSIMSPGNRSFFLQLIQEVQDGDKAQTKRTDKSSFLVLCKYVLSRATTGAQDKSQHEQLTTLSSDDPATVILQGRSSIDQAEDRMLALAYKRRSTECVFQSIKVSQDFPATFQLGQDDDMDVDNGDSAAVPNKRKLQTSTTDVLGPGQAGNENIPIAKKRKVRTGSMDDHNVDDLDEGKETSPQDEDEEGANMTIAERLQQLKDALDEEEDEDDDDEEDEESVDDEADVLAGSKSNVTFKPKMATTESLKELLTQALQSSDDGMLELALAVRDAKIVSRTLRDLDDPLLVTLLGKLTTRLAASPLRAEALSVWISYCLKLGTFEPQILSTLKNMLYERIESFPDLLRLEGRLSMMIEADE